MSFCNGVVASFSFVCGVSVSIFIRDFVSVLVVKGDWKSL